MIPRESTFDPGIYFGMPDESYHADPSLGSTDLRRLLQSAADFHWEWRGNPDRDDEEEKEALIFGRAVHKMVLEGPAAFERYFELEPQGPDVLRTIDDMKGWLRVRGLEEKGLKQVLSDRIETYDARAKIADRIKERAEAAGRTLLNASSYKRIRIASAYITKNTELAGSFEDGKAEVSIFWIRRGIRLKARIDFLKTYWNPEYKVQEVLNTDLKSFRNRRQIDVEKAIDLTVNDYKLQAAHYTDALKHIGTHVTNGDVFGEGLPDDDWLARVARAKRVVNAFVCYKASGAPFADARFISPGNGLLDIAARDIEVALDRFELNYNHFGAQGPWVSLQKPRELAAEDLPRWAI